MGFFKILLASCIFSFYFLITFASLLYPKNVSKMMVHTLFFSPTGSTKKVVTELGSKIADKLAFDPVLSPEEFDFTLPEQRAHAPEFSHDDIVVFGMPVYAGRIPNVLLPYLKTIRGGGAKVISVVVYGNRNYDDALMELNTMLSENGFVVIGSGAFVGEHAFSTHIAKDRPDESDMHLIHNFAEEIAEKIKEGRFDPVQITGKKVHEITYYQPKYRDGSFIDIRKVKPLTNDRCSKCGVCVHLCPMGSIDKISPDVISGICIKCCACVRCCPENAKYFEDSGFLFHVKDLEETLGNKRSENFLFL